MEGGPLAGAAGATAGAGRPDAPPQPRLLCCGPHDREVQLRRSWRRVRGRRLLSSSNPVPMGSPRLDCSSFFTGGVLVRRNSLHALDEHCRLRLVSSRCVLRPPSHRSVIAIEVRRSARLLHLQLCAAVRGLLDSFFPTCLFFLAAHMLLFL